MERTAVSPARTVAGEIRPDTAAENGRRRFTNVPAIAGTTVQAGYG
jgi:hypothetical protein